MSAELTYTSVIKHKSIPTAALDLSQTDCQSLAIDLYLGGIDTLTSWCSNQPLRGLDRDGNVPLMPADRHVQVR